MTNPHLDLPQAHAADDESFGPVTRTSRSLYLAAIVFLGTSLLAGVVGWIGLAALNRQAPESLGVILGTIAGGLVTAIAGKTRA